MGFTALDGEYKEAVAFDFGEMSYLKASDFRGAKACVETESEKGPVGGVGFLTGIKGVK